MELEVLNEKLDLLLKNICEPPTDVKAINISWLNKFCAEFLEFSNMLHKFMNHQMRFEPNKELEEMICLCLAQIVICIRHMEFTILAENACGASIPASRQHFLDRICWCVKRLRATGLERNATSQERSMEELSFLTLVDSVFDALTPFSCYSNEEVNDVEYVQLTDEREEIVSASRQIRHDVDLVLSQTLAFANVALQKDKKALSALCQKVLRDCSAFQAECERDPSSNRKLQAMSLEHALYQLENYINEALLRLVYACFLDFEKYSVAKMRTTFRNALPNATSTDEIIADFDVNVDRTTQIGVFAIAFAPSLKMKTIVRSCLASFESLDTSLVPALQANGADLHAELLEQHFNEEVTTFKKALQEIIDSSAFVGCYLEMLTNGLSEAEKHFEKTQLQDLTQMGFFLVQHFQLSVNQKVLLQTQSRVGQKYFQQFTKMLRECKAILMCASQVDAQRIIKRFKILRTTLRKLHGSIAVDRHHTEPLVPSAVDTDDSDEVIVNGDLLESLDIEPLACSIFYDTLRRRGGGNKLLHKSSRKSPSDTINRTDRLRSTKTPIYNSVRRRESLRTVMFKRQNIAENRQFINTDSTNSTSLQISDILDQLTCLSSTFSKSTLRNDVKAYN